MSETWNGKAAPVEGWVISFGEARLGEQGYVTCCVRLGGMEAVYQTVQLTLPVSLLVSVDELRQDMFEEMLPRLGRGIVGFVGIGQDEVELFEQLWREAARVWLERRVYWERVTAELVREWNKTFRVLNGKP